MTSDTANGQAGRGEASPLDAAAVAAMRAEAVQITAELIRIESVNTGDPATIGDGETRVCRRIAELLDEVGLDSELVESDPGRGSLFARFEGADADAGALVVHGHVDVVPAAAADWSVPPFSGEIRDGWLYGRGAVDMKNMLGMTLAAVRAMRRAGIVPRRTVILAFFADEEHAGLRGAKWMVENRPDLFAGATHAISEVGGFSVQVGEKRLYPVATAEKGVGWAQLRAGGTAGHASMPTADNAVGRLVEAMARVSAHRFPLTETESIGSLCRELAGILGFEPKLEELAAHLDDLGFLAPMVRATLSDTASVTVAEAGYKVNVIPTEARGAIDGRVLPGSEGTFRRQLEELLGEDVEVEWVWTPPISAPVDDPLVDTIRAAVAAADPDGVVVPYLLPASTDNKHLDRLGIRGYGFVPLRVPADFDVFGTFHAVDERVPVAALEFGVTVLEQILRTA